MLKRKTVDMRLCDNRNHHIMQTEKRGNIMKKNTNCKTNSTTDYIGYALYAFGGLGLEILLMMIETNLYGMTSGSWSTMQHIIHWMITCIIWGCLGVMLVK